jgi:hypothetical protein
MIVVRSYYGLIDLQTNFPNMTIGSENMVYPTYRFSQVEVDLFRGGYPKERNIGFLKRLQLKTILSLTPNPIDLLQQVNCIHIKIDKPKENIPISFQKMNQILQIVLDNNAYPLYIHCLDGQLITSIVLMCLRKLMGWDMNSIRGESIRFLKEEALNTEQQEYIEKYQPDFEASNPPFWFTSKKKFKLPETAVESATPPQIERLDRSSVMEEARLSRTILALDLDIKQA